MPEEYTRLGPIRATYSRSEIAPALPAARIVRRPNPQEQSNSYPQQPSEQRSRARRRFKAMRRLLNRLKQQRGFQRVDFNTAEKEMRAAGRQLVEDHLTAALGPLLHPAELHAVAAEWRSQLPSAPTKAGRPLLHAEALGFPTAPLGLCEFQLEVTALHLEPSQLIAPARATLKEENYLAQQSGPLRIQVGRPDPQHPDNLVVRLEVSIGVVEIDPAGRRVILYQRPDQSHGLYMDKPIDLKV